MTMAAHVAQVGPRRILIVEDHSLLRKAMISALAELPETSVVGAGTVRAALAEIHGVTPNLVVSDLDLPDGSGLELLPVLQQDPKVPVLFVSAHVSRFQSQLSRYPGVVVLEKPLPARTLKEVVAQQFDAGTTRDAPPFGAGDYIQLACMGRHSVRIDVVATEVSGSIFIQRGRLWAAVAGGVEGVAALSKLTFVQGAEVRCSGGSSNTGPANLPDQPWEQLLLDLARDLDEGTREIPVAGADDTNLIDVDDLDFSDIFDEPTVVVDEPEPSQGAMSVRDEARFNNLVDRAADALLGKDYAEALRLYESAQLLNPHDSMVGGNVSRLRELTSNDD